MENQDGGQEQRQLSEEDGSASKEDMSPRLDSPNPTENVRLWVLEISASGLIDTPRMHAVRHETINPTTLVGMVVDDISTREFTTFRVFD